MVMNTPRGTRDLINEDAEVFEHVINRFKIVARLNGFKPIVTPVIEYFELFAKKSGEEIVRSMYVFKDKAGRMLALRPELTAPVIRAYLSKLKGKPKPLRLYYVGQCFRYEEPQRGRYREFWQAGLEVIGDPGLEADAIIASTINELLKSLGLQHEFIVGNVGIYRKIMCAYKVPVERQDHILHLIDKGEVDKALAYSRFINPDFTEVLKVILRSSLDRVSEVIMDYKIDEGTVKGVVDEVEKTRNFIELLNEIGIKAVYEPKLVRGLAYYTGLIYEVKTPALNISIGGGGRYDGLTEVYGGSFEYSTGAALGIDRLLLALQKKPVSAGGFAAVIVLGSGNESAAKVGLQVIRKLHEYGVSASLFSGRKLGKILSRISKENYRFAIIIGEREVSKGKITVKDLATGEQSIMSLQESVRFIAEHC